MVMCCDQMNRNKGNKTEFKLNIKVNFAINTLYTAQNTQLFDAHQLTIFELKTGITHISIEILSNFCIFFFVREIFIKFFHTFYFIYAGS